MSVVVASHNALPSIAECLATLVAQRAAAGVEIVVVDNSTDGTTEVIRERFPDVKLVEAPPSALIPELWEAGMCQSTGDIIAITTAHCVPGKDWVAEMLRGHEGGVAAVGGAIENGESAGIVDWAIYFCRYSQFMLPFAETFAPEVPGDNASYKRVYLDRCRHVWRNGFWEPAVHAELKKAGLRLLLAPSIVVYHKTSFDLWGFMKQRFQHGRQFGEWRASRLAGPTRALYVALSPVIPLVLLVRIVRQVLTKRRHRKALVVAVPVLLLFLLAWTVGELIGYLRGPAE